MADLVDAPEQGNASTVEAPVSDIPEHLQGKSEQELVDMYRNLERKLGSQSEELGQLRGLVDHTILNQASGQTEASADEVDFFTNPEAAVRQVIQQELRPFQQQQSRQRQAETKIRLDTDFPGWTDTVKNEDFVTWVTRSKHRAQLYQAGDSGDYDAAAELLETWQGLSASKKDTEKAARKAVSKDRKARAATTEKGAAGIDPRKILRRADLQELRLNNPDRYQALMPDIMRAYQEGRVK